MSKSLFLSPTVSFERLADVRAMQLEEPSNLRVS